VSENISILKLPPYSPELNPIERLWPRLKKHFLSNRMLTRMDAILVAGVAAWRSLSDADVRSICQVSWLPTAPTA
jgi:transposase